MLRFIARETKTQGDIPIGIRGENKARQIIFPIVQWQEVLGEGHAELLVQRSGDAQPYPVPLTMEGKAAVWTVTGTDVAKPGIGKARLNYYVGDTIAKSVTWNTRTEDDPLSEPGEVPEAPEQPWIEQVLAAVGNIYTPIKGVDYWTPEDRQSMVDDVLATFPVWEGGAY